MKKKIFFLVGIVTFFSCQNEKPEKNKIVGRWEEKKQGTIIELKNDNILVFKNIPTDLNLFRDIRTRKHISGEGTWDLEFRNGRWEVAIFLKKISGIEEQYILPVNIANNFGDIGLFIWKGDPDSGNRYSFEKVPD